MIAPESGEEIYEVIMAKLISGIYQSKGRLQDPKPISRQDAKAAGYKWKTKKVRKKPSSSS
jgi:hypothetical protein